MKKFSIKKSLLGLVLSAGIFTAGVYVQAETDLVGQVKGDAKREVREAIYNKQEEIIADIQTSAVEVVKQALQPTVDQKKKEYTTKLDTYYQTKLSEIANRPEFADIETEIDTEAQATYERYLDDIDAAINSLLQ